MLVDSFGWWILISGNESTKFCGEGWDFWRMSIWEFWWSRGQRDNWFWEQSCGRVSLKVDLLPSEGVWCIYSEKWFVGSKWPTCMWEATSRFWINVGKLELVFWLRRGRSGKAYFLRSKATRKWRVFRGDRKAKKGVEFGTNNVLCCKNARWQLLG